MRLTLYIKIFKVFFIDGKNRYIYEKFLPNIFKKTTIFLYCIIKYICRKNKKKGIVQYIYYNGVKVIITKKIYEKEVTAMDSTQSNFKELNYAKLKNDQEEKLKNVERNFNEEFGTDYYFMVVKK